MSHSCRFAGCGLPLPACLAVCLIAGAVATTRGDEAGSQSSVRLATLAASRQWLQPPANLKGDFHVAAVPPRVDFAVYPGQREGARLWSSWGEATFASNGRFYASVGDHDAPHGTAFVYSIDVAKKSVQRVVDFNDHLSRGANQYTPGKIHCPLVEGHDQALYFFGYRGSVRKTTAEADYTGDWLLRYQLDDGHVENLGIPIAFSSVPVLAATADGKGLYGISVPGQTMPDPTPQFFHYDLVTRKVVFRAALEAQGPRSIVIGERDRAFFGYRDGPTSQGRLACYDPAERAVRRTNLKIPGDGMLRAASRVDRNGVAWCFSKDGVVFALDTRRERIRVVTRAFVAGKQYVATCRLGPQERYLYYVPEAHGRSGAIGSPLIQLDVQNGQRKVIAFLNQTTRSQQAYNLGGTYGIALNKDGSQVLINWNGAKLPAGRQSEFGLCAAMIVHVPASERPSPEQPTDGSPIRFRDATDAAQLRKPLAGLLGHGAAVADFDGDGHVDIYVGGFCDRPDAAYAPSSGPIANQMFRNTGLARFERVNSPELNFFGRTSGAVAVDLDNDGSLELYVANNARARTRKTEAPQRDAQLMHSRLFQRRGGSWRDVSRQSGACPESLLSARNIGVLDFDADGLLDLLVVEDIFRPGSARTTLFRNRGMLRFEDANQRAGLPDGIHGLGLAVADVNGDRRPDFFVPHSNRFFLSRGDGTYYEPEALAKTFAWEPLDREDWPCGAVFGDLNNDGRLDMVLSIHSVQARNRVYLNQGLHSGEPRFLDVTDHVGLGETVPTRCPHVEIQDFDNDGYPDIYMSAAWKSDDGRITPLIYRNQGIQGGLPRFEPPRKIEDPMVYYPAGPSADFNGDGRMDLFLVNWFEENHCRLLLGDSRPRSWLKVRVQGRSFNRMGIGSEVRVYQHGPQASERRLLGFRQIQIGYGYASGQVAECHFGLGRHRAVDLRITLPDGRMLERSNVAVNQRLLIQEPDRNPN